MGPAGGSYILYGVGGALQSRGARSRAPVLVYPCYCPSPCCRVSGAIFFALLTFVGGGFVCRVSGAKSFLVACHVLFFPLFWGGALCHRPPPCCRVSGAEKRPENRTEEGCVVCVYLCVCV
jgi:hypothetical protein